MHGETTTPVSSSGGEGPWLLPGRHPIGPTPVPRYPGRQKHCTVPEVARQTAMGLQPPLPMLHGPMKTQVSPLPR